MSGPQPLEPEHVVLVIHGVGDPQPGETLSLFARSIAEPDKPLIERQETIWLNEKSEHATCVQTFGAHLRQLQLRQSPVCLAEVFWGDVSRVRKGILGALLGLVEIVFGLHYVAFAAAHQNSPAASALQSLGTLATGILHGPVLAVTYFLGLMTLTLAGTELAWSESHRAEFWARILILGCAAVAWTSGWIGQQMTRNAGIKEFWFWVKVLAIFMLGLALCKMFWLDHRLPNLMATNQIKPGLIWYCDVLVMFLGLLWLVEMIVLMGMSFAWLTANLSPGSQRRSLHVAFLLPAMAVGFWGLVMPMAWLAAARSLRRFVQLSDFEKLFNEAVPLLGVQCLMAVLVALAGGAVLVRYGNWRKRALRAAAGSGFQQPPRLIVHGGLQVVLAICTVIGMSGVAGVSILLMRGVEIERLWLGFFLVQANNSAAGILMPLGFLLFLAFPHLRPALDIMLDVINHFFFRPTRLEDSLDGDEFDIRETTLDEGQLFFARRDAVHLRIKQLLAWFRDNLETRPKLTIISHSQGTMIGIEVLNDPELAWLNRSFSSVRLVTMGSPFSHIYQHYFGHLYPDLSNEAWLPLRSRLARWMNVYRRDDFVGTRIDFPLAARVEGVSADGPVTLGIDSDCICSNHPVGLRGHLNYWSDREVLAVLRAELLEEKAAQDKKEAADGLQVRRAA
ncbi:MAG: hypothetical protein ACK49R_13325 [Planctomycetota bacterium]